MGEIEYLSDHRICWRRDRQHQYCQRNSGRDTAIKKRGLSTKCSYSETKTLQENNISHSGKTLENLKYTPLLLTLRNIPEIVKIISNDKVQYAASNWHSDVTWRQEPSMGSILRGRVIPEVGGDTSFANTAEAYNRLDPQIKDQVDSLYAIHDFSKTFGRNMSEKRKIKTREISTGSASSHSTHPETGERGIYTNQPFVSHRRNKRRGKSAPP